jgi:hypothetical protein
MARTHLTGSLLCATALLSGCGGGGGVNVATTPAPPVAVAATPEPSTSTPTPTPAATTSVPSAGKDAYAVAGTFGEQPNNRLVGPDRERLKFDYDASSGIYLIGPYQYGPADSNPAESENGNFRFFDPVSGWGDTLTVLTNSSNNSRIVLSYLSYGLYIPVNGPGVFNQPAVEVFIFGTETPANNMPRTGSATYQGIIDGVGFDGAAALQQGLRGSTGSLTANFATGSVSTSLSLSAADFNGTLSGSGTIGAGTSHFDGSLTGALNGSAATGSFLGGFYGPNAAEAGYVFNAATGTPANPGIGAVGAFVGKQ